MSTQTTKTFVPGSAKSQETSIGTVIRMGFNVEKLSEFITKHANEKGWINIDVVPKKEVGQYGDTHSLVLNEWKPKEGAVNTASNTKPATKPAGKGKAATRPAPTSEPAEGGGDDIPF